MVILVCLGEIFRKVLGGGAFSKGVFSGGVFSKGALDEGAFRGWALFI